MTKRELERVVEPIPGIRIVATPDALDTLQPPSGVDLVDMRLAPDELLRLGTTDAPRVADDHAIVFVDHGWAGAWLPTPALVAFLEAGADWPVPPSFPAFCQGMSAHIAVKCWLAEPHSLIVVPLSVASDLAGRLEAYT